MATQIGFAEDMMSAYPTSKGALLQLIRSTAVEHARYGVRVNALCPGAVDTALPRTHLATAEDPTPRAVGSRVSPRLGGC